MKKITYKIYILLVLSGLAVFVSSCLKDNYTDFSKVGDVIEFLGIRLSSDPTLTVVDAPGVATIALNPNPKQTFDDTVQLLVNQTGQYATTKDIPVTIALNPAALATFNSDTNNVAGTLLPDSAYSLSTTGTITAGKDALGNPNRTVAIVLLLHPSKVPATPGVNYVLPISITSVPAGYVISANYGTLLLNFYHNPYDGDYTGVGVRYNFATASDFAGWDNTTNTPKAGSVIVSTAPWNFPHVPVKTVNGTLSTVHAGNDLTAFGQMNIKVNPNNTVTISQGGSSLNGLTNTPGTVSTYDPVAKVFHLYYVYQNLNSDGTPSTFRALKETLTHN